MSRSDVRQIKRLAERLGARDSDVIRFAIKSMLATLAPLPDPNVTGRSLVPVFVESGAELMRHFDLDASRLAAIINEGADDTRRVEAEDIHLLAMSGNHTSYAKLRFAGVTHANGNGHGNGHSNGYAHHGSEPIAMPPAADSMDQSLRHYLYEKYLYSRSSDPTQLRTNGL